MSKKKMPKELVVINYSMDVDSQVFSHQIDIVNKLSSNFGTVTAITNFSSKNCQVSSNVTIKNINWEESSKMLAVCRLFKYFFEIVRKNRNIIVFSHMTEVHSALLAPITFFLRIPHVLWYAHKSNSLALRWANFWVDSVLTSTPGSFPFKSRKLQIIGQMIDHKLFKFNHNPRKSLVKFVHVGRVDPSKNIEAICDFFININHLGKFTLTFFGTASSFKYKYYEDYVKNKYLNRNDIFFDGPISRQEVPSRLSAYDLFVHSYNGSLDKSVVEATLLGLPVITTNEEYLRTFGSWSGKFLASISLNEEYFSLVELAPEKRKKILIERKEFAVLNHSFDSWHSHLIRVLNSFS